ncbi:MAG: carbon-nitrogen hydrolase family protein [Alphaproteobacteria bacterium]|nr:carbon-nitrogen hydrolase family protein [Alphaproteobacteria bacterium]
MKIAVFQGPAADHGVAGNLARMAELAKEAAHGGARLLILPEMYLTGYHIGPEAVARLAEPANGPSVERARAIARDRGLALLYGYPERDDQGRIYNAAILIDRDGGTLANHRKTHLFGDIDKSAFSPGERASTVAELDGVRIGILICYDVEFPENARLLALAGVDIVAVPTALMAPYDAIARTMVAARAYENQVFLAYANRTGSERELDYLGLSCILAPDGTELARAGRDEALITADLDFSRLKASRAINTYLRDRRPELYAPLNDDLPLASRLGDKS